MSLGEERVRADFNPSKSSAVDLIKQQAAKFINTCNALSDKTTDPEVGRCLSIAMTHMETAAMYAVKAATSSKLANS